MPYSAPYRNNNFDDGFDDFDDLDSAAASDNFDDGFDSFDDPPMQSEGFDDFDDYDVPAPYGADMPMQNEEFEPGPAKPIKEKKAHIYILSALSAILVIVCAFCTAYFDRGFLPKDILNIKVGGATVGDLFKIGSAEELIEHVPEKETKPDEPVYTEENMPDSVRYADFEIYEGNTYCAVTGYNGTKLEIALPASYNGKPCTRIEANAFTESPVTSVEIPDSYTYIGQNAFSNCSITDLYLPDSVTEIGWGMCSGNTYLESVRLPSSLETIAEWSFSGCSSLTKLEIPGNVKTVGQWAFTDCVSISDLKLSEGIEKLDNCAFYGCSDISMLIVPSSVTSIGEMCFRSCTSLLIVSAPETLTEIGKNAFMNCSQVLTFFGQAEGVWATYAEENGFAFDLIENLDLTEGDDPVETSSTDISPTDISPTDVSATDPQ